VPTEVTNDRGLEPEINAKNLQLLLQRRRNRSQPHQGVPMSAEFCGPIRLRTSPSAQR
jgi:hypothetical protein